MPNTSIMSRETRHEIVVISKVGCHICDEAIRTLESLKKDHDFELNILSIDDDADLFEKYWIKVPVIRLDGKDIFEAEDIALPIDRSRRLKGLVC